MKSKSDRSTDQSESFFSVVTKYERTPNRDPGEDRLTQVFASLCLYVDGLAGPLLSNLTNDSVREGSFSSRQQEVVNRLGEEGGHPRVVTQERRESGRPDLVLEFEAGSIVIEIKGPSESPLTRDQLKKYEGEGEIVCLLAPGGYFVDEDQRPDPFIHLSWQMLGEKAKEGEASTRTPQEAWLVEQFIRYLKEEKVMNEAIMKAAGGGTEFDAMLSSLDLSKKLEDFLEEVAGRVSDVMKANGWQPNVTERKLKDSIPRTKTWPARLRNWSPPDQLPDDPESQKRREAWAVGNEQNELEWRIGGSPERPESSVDVSAGLVFRPKNARPPILLDPEPEELNDLKKELGLEELGLTLTTDEIDTYQPWFIATTPLSELLLRATERSSEFDIQVKFAADWILDRLHGAGRVAGLIAADEEPWIAK